MYYTLTSAARQHPFQLPKVAPHEAPDQLVRPRVVRHGTLGHRIPTGRRSARPPGGYWDPSRSSKKPQPVSVGVMRSASVSAALNWFCVAMSIRWCPFWHRVSIPVSLAKHVLVEPVLRWVPAGYRIPVPRQPRDVVHGLRMVALRRSRHRGRRQQFAEAPGATSMCTQLGRGWTGPSHPTTDRHLWCRADCSVWVGDRGRSCARPRR